MNCADQKNPLQHSGTSQQERQLPAMQEHYVRTDEHDFPDWIVFASSFSQYLNYYNEANVVSNNWQPFFDNDNAAVLGSVAIQHIDVYQQEIKERLLFLRDDANKNDLNELKATMGSLFSGMLTLSLSLDHYLFRLPQAHTWRLTLQNTITQTLQPALKKLLSYYKGGRLHKRSDHTEDPSLNVIANKDYPKWIILGNPVFDVLETINTQNLSPLWLEGQPSLKAFFTGIAADNSIFGKEDDAPYKRIQHAANHNLFVSLLHQFLSSYAGLISGAEKALGAAISQDNAHAPHYALFLSFLHLYRLAQDELNTLTRRHLEFYYQRVLRLQPKNALPNSAHLIVELAKEVIDFSLPQGTLFRAGKDSLGKEVFYALDKETIFNQAKVARIMSVYRGGAAEKIGAVSNLGRLFAAPFANSTDGLGKELKPPDVSWQPFVNKSFKEGKLTSINTPKADIGFAIASPYLLLAAGDREIILRLELESLPEPFPALLFFDGFLTTAKEWLKVSVTVTAESKKTGTADALMMQVVLPGNTPAITNYIPKVHGGTYRQLWPMLRLLLVNEDTQPYPYDLLKKLNLNKISLSVFVGVDSETGAATKTGLQQLQLANEFGPVDPSKPFLPFGLTPGKGSSFVIGNEEFFKKPGATFQLKMKWLDLPSAEDMDYDAPAGEGDLSPKVSLFALKNGSWQSPLLTAQNLWLESGKDTIGEESIFPTPPLSLSAVSGDAAFLPFESTYGPYSVHSSSGYLKLTLDQGFGYDNYQKAYGEYLAGIAFGKGTDPGSPPYVPKLESISLHYSATITDTISATTKVAFEEKAVDFYHLYPFGTAETHGFLTPGQPVSLMPQFVSESGAGAALDSGELYIGLSGLKGLSAVNLLFGIVAGTSDPLIVKPENHLTWSYLSNNQWKEFDDRAVGDGTLGWLQTGIISLAIPEDATTDNTVLPADLLWLRASVSSQTMAVCKLLAIDAQAAVVTFSNNQNATDFLDLPLPAATISKLKDPGAATPVKKITQPYSSFGGRPTENKDAYYRRVSERLRHKDRAITIWDYEHLILEAFPMLHRVKCLSHTSYVQLSNGSKKFNEMAPGHVTIITIPSLQNGGTVNPLRPYTNESTLAAIADFMQERISCHITPHVVHPLFEEIALAFDLMLAPGFDDYTFYMQTLQQEITSFLTPWAFGQSTEVSFGGKVIKSVLINFIEERPYVDYISNVMMYHRTEAAPASMTNLEEITASSGMAILVSVSPEKHLITPISKPNPATIKATCVDAFAEQDFTKKD